MFNSINYLKHNYKTKQNISHAAWSKRNEG